MDQQHPNEGEDGIDSHPARRVVVGGVADIRVKFGVEVIAERVETRADLDALRSLGLRFFQGYLFARPGSEMLPDGQSRTCERCVGGTWSHGVRIAVIGTSGAGKTTLSRHLANRLGLPHIELDAINWQADWRDLTRHDPDEFVRQVTRAVAADSWVVEGNYAPVHAIVWQRATHLVWLDYERGVIMRRVILRSLRRVALRTPLWAGNRERWSFLLHPSHPIRWAWSTWARRRQEMEAWLTEPAYRHLVTMRLRHPREAEGAIERLVRMEADGGGC